MTLDLPQLLRRARFSIDLISSDLLMRRAKFVNNFYPVPHNGSLIPTLRKQLKQNYDWIIPTEDGIIKEILDSTLSLKEKSQLLPVQNRAHFGHLFSKIGLSKAFLRNQISTPPFLIAENLEQALLSAKQLGYPVLVKIDTSSGGTGVFGCYTDGDLKNIKPKVFENPVLIQKKIPGIELDLSALYLEGNLIHFSYSKIEKTVYQFGPSSLRTYRSLSAVEEPIFQELAQIGKALGAHGFTNMGCIQSGTTRFYFEVDMRPNVWVETPKFFGEDPAIRIRNWFSQKQILSPPIPQIKNQPIEMLIPYYLRLKRSDLLWNRYNVWKFIPKQDKKLAAKLLFNFFFPDRTLSAFIKMVTPKKSHPMLRSLKKRCFPNPSVLAKELI